MIEESLKKNEKPAPAKDVHILNIESSGYAHVKQVFTREQMDLALSIIRDWENKISVGGEIPRLNKGQPNVYNLQNKNWYLTELILSNSEIERLLVYFLNDKFYRQIPQHEPNYILRSFGARSSKAALPLHIDSFVPYEGSIVTVMQVAIMLEDSNFENGCTLVVPGSHLSGVYANDETTKQKIISSNPNYSISNSTAGTAIAIEAKVGDVLIWDSRLHHGTTENTSNGTRWAIVATFCRWWIKQHFDIPKGLPSDIYSKLTPKFRSILGFNSIPPVDETIGVDMKKGYEED